MASCILDHAQALPDMTGEQAAIVAKKRLETFQFRPASISSSTVHNVSLHSRSHSRSGSVVSLSFSNSQDSVPEASSNSQAPSGTRSRPNSHHRRRSSVSTRAESADLMGVTITELPAPSPDNMSFGDKDSIRRRALLALEGHRDFDTNIPSAKVEIPQFDDERVITNFGESLEATEKSNLFGVSNAVASKRDSFGRLLTPASSMKDHLGTLLEEEEDEESPASTVVESVSTQNEAEDNTSAQYELSTPERPSIETPELSITTPSPAPQRHRPASLILRPFSLLNQGVNLPTPSLTPSPRGLPLKNLTLASEGSVFTPPAEERMSITQVSSPSPSPAFFGRRHSLDRTSALPTVPSSMSKPSTKRQSSISYIKSGSSPTPGALPTPGATPTSERRPSISSSISDTESLRERSASSDQAFIYHTHATLLARIADLERALHSRPKSRTSSINSEWSAAASEPPDEMLHLVSDLKSERDDLKRDVESWRQRVEDVERSKELLERRIEVERREAWLKGEKLGLVEVENQTLAKRLENKDTESKTRGVQVISLKAQVRKLTSERDMARQRLNEVQKELVETQQLLKKEMHAESELAELRVALASEKRKRESFEARLIAIEKFSLANQWKMEQQSRPPLSPRRHDLSLKSIESMSSATDCDSVDGHRSAIVPLALKVVHEEDEEDDLAQYEDEDPDMSFTDSMSTSSSFDFHEAPRSNAHLQQRALTPVNETPSRSYSVSPTPSPSPCVTPVLPTPPPDRPTSHANRAFLSKAWTFPRHVQPSPTREAEVDHFFGCLEDIDVPSKSDERLDDRSMFSRSLRDADEDMPPFILPVQPSDPKMLDAVIEEDDADESMDIVGQEVDGGIRFCFAPVTPTKDEKEVPSLPALPALADLSFGSFMATDSPKTPNMAMSSPKIQSTTFPSSAIKKPSPARVSAIPVSFAARPVTPRKVSNTAVPSPLAMAAAPSRIPPPSPSRSLNIAPKKPAQTISRKPVPTAVFTPAPKPLTLASKATTRPSANTASQSKAGPHTNDDMNTNDSTLTRPLSASTKLIDEDDKRQHDQQQSDSTLLRDFSRDSHGVHARSFTSRFLLQKFTNMIPIPSLSWNGNQQGSVIADSDPHPQESGYEYTRKQPTVLQPRSKDNYKNTFVTRESQLARLKARMDLEREGNFGFVHGSRTAVDIEMSACARCRGDVFCL